MIFILPKYCLQFPLRQMRLPFDLDPAAPAPPRTLTPLARPRRKELSSLKAACVDIRGRNQRITVGNRLLGLSQNTFG